MKKLTQEKAFELAKKEISYAHQVTANNFYLAEAEMDEESWVLKVGYMTYFTDEDIGSEVAEYYGWTDEDIGTPSGHWQTRVIVEPDGSTYTATDDNLDLTEHPSYEYSI